MKEVVWVVGHSGVGKETFCRSIADNPDSRLVEQLGWTGLRIGICVSSLAAASRGPNKEKVEHSDKIITELKDKQSLLDVILLKWQALDTQNGRVKEVEALFDETTMRALVLQAEDNLVQERHQGRDNTWNPKEGWESFLRHEEELIAAALIEFKIIDYIDSASGYELISDPTS